MSRTKRYVSVAFLLVTTVERNKRTSEAVLMRLKSTYPPSPPPNRFKMKRDSPVVFFHAVFKRVRQDHRSSG
jgi:hypothetical protein